MIIAIRIDHRRSPGIRILRPVELGSLESNQKGKCMILCAALKIKSKELILPCLRHGDGFALIRELSGESTFGALNNIEQGFITTNGVFLNRREAYKHALDCGQLSISTIQYKDDRKDNELYSEDLY